MPYSVRLHMRDVVKYATKKRKNICADDGDKNIGPTCYLLSEKDMSDALKESYVRRNNKTMFLDAKDINIILNQCASDEDREKMIGRWCNARHGLIIDNFDYIFDDTELQKIMLRVVSARMKKQMVTELLTYQDFYVNEEKIIPDLYMMLVTSFYRKVSNDYEMDLTSRCITMYCKD